MPTTIPPFAQYQQPMFPLRGLLGEAPSEGKKFISCEIDWLTGTGNLTAMQFSLAGNSPVALSQICALYVDNTRSGTDVAFVFPDTAFELVVPAREQGLYPVLTNALMFYAVGASAVSSDVTIVQILNHVPPPVAIPQSNTQSQVGSNGVALGANGTTQIVPLGTNGTLENINLAISAQAGAGGGSAVLTLADGTGKKLWQGTIALGANGVANYSIPIGPINMRFTNGITLQVSGTTLTGTWVVPNLYFTQP